MKEIHSDLYSEAIPIEELARLARADVSTSMGCSKQAIRERAESVVREKLCPCTTTVDSIVDAVVDEYMRQLGGDKITLSKK